MLDSYKQLVVWQKSIVLVKELYKITELFPKSELYGLVSQIRRAAVSIPSNIAEGYKRKNIGEYLQFLRIAEGSAAELETQIIISNDLFTTIRFEKISSLLEEVQKMLFVMIKHLDIKRTSLYPKPSTLNPRNGFTLIELIIYIAIIGIVIAGFVSYSLSVSGVRNKNYSAATVQANGRAALQIMTKKIHEAQAVLTPLAGASNSELVLDMPGASPNITFSVSSGILYITEAGSPATTITDSRTKISNLVFTNLAALGERANVRMEITIDYNVPTGDVGLGYSKSYRTAVSTRL